MCPMPARKKNNKISEKQKVLESEEYKKYLEENVSGLNNLKHMPSVNSEIENEVKNSIDEAFVGNEDMSINKPITEDIVVENAIKQVPSNDKNSEVIVNEVSDKVESKRQLKSKNLKKKAKEVKKKLNFSKSELATNENKQLENILDNNEASNQNLNILDENHHIRSAEDLNPGFISKIIIKNPIRKQRKKNFEIKKPKVKTNFDENSRESSSNLSLSHEKEDEIVESLQNIPGHSILNDDPSSNFLKFKIHLPSGLAGESLFSGKIEDLENKPEVSNSELLHHDDSTVPIENDKLLKDNINICEDDVPKQNSSIQEIASNEPMVNSLDEITLDDNEKVQELSNIPEDNSNIIDNCSLLNDSVKSQISTNQMIEMESAIQNNTEVHNIESFSDVENLNKISNHVDDSVPAEKFHDFSIGNDHLEQLDISQSADYSIPDLQNIEKVLDPPSNEPEERKESQEIASTLQNPEPLNNSNILVGHSEFPLLDSQASENVPLNNPEASLLSQNISSVDCELDKDTSKSLNLDCSEHLEPNIPLENSSIISESSDSSKTEKRSQIEINTVVGDSLYISNEVNNHQSLPEESHESLDLISSYYSDSFFTNHPSDNDESFSLSFGLSESSESVDNVTLETKAESSICSVEEDSDSLEFPSFESHEFINWQQILPIVGFLLKSQDHIDLKIAAKPIKEEVLKKEQLKPKKTLESDAYNDMRYLYFLKKVCFLGKNDALYYCKDQAKFLYDRGNKNKATNILPFKTYKAVNETNGVKINFS